MKTIQSRRTFIKQGAVFCTACGAFALCPGMRAMTFARDDEKPDPLKLEYCGYKCPDDCPMYLATINNDTAAKKEAFDTWELEERYGIQFDAEKVFCYGCKVEDKPVGISAQHCDVRNCAIEKEYACCIECKELPACEKGVFSQFPDFHNAVVEMQKKYNEA